MELNHYPYNHISMIWEMQCTHTKESQVTTSWDTLSTHIQRIPRRHTHTWMKHKRQIRRYYYLHFLHPYYCISRSIKDNLSMKRANLKKKKIKICFNYILIDISFYLHRLRMLLCFLFCFYSLHSFGYILFSSHIFNFLQDVLSEEEVAELEKEYMKFLRHEIHVEGRDFCDMSSDYYTKSLEEYSIINIMLPSRYVLYVMIFCCIGCIYYLLLSYMFSYDWYFNFVFYLDLFTEISHLLFVTV